MIIFIQLIQLKVLKILLNFKNFLMNKVDNIRINIFNIKCKNNVNNNVNK